jgi:hypothetical protein
MKLDGLGVARQMLRRYGERAQRLPAAVRQPRTCTAVVRGYSVPAFPPKTANPGRRTHMPRAVRCRRLDLVRTGNGYGTVPRGTTHWTGWLVI